MNNNHNIQKNNKLNITAILVPITASIMLLLAKTYGYFVTDSLSILSSLLDSFMDVFISALNMVAVIYASKPPDEDHRFGHNAIEDIVGLIQATFIATTAFFVLYKAADSFIHPTTIDDNMIGVWVMVFSVVMPLLVVIYQKMIIRKTKSIVVESDMMHYLTDVLVNGAIIISLLLAINPKFRIIDPILAALIALYILSSAIKIGKRSFNNLMDMELEEGQKDKIRALIDGNKKIKGYHAFKTRRSGNRVFVQIHIEVDKKLSLDKAHDIVDTLEADIANIWLESDVIIHLDPI
jgi:ferrous-iron efflux pump FieF